jgi:hypothetical protein
MVDEKGGNLTTGCLDRADVRPGTPEAQLRAIHAPISFGKQTQDGAP